ncbi:MAG: AraC family ligand binding domain-containing protein, partial [Burkholderiales bacterium]
MDNSLTVRLDEQRSELPTARESTIEGESSRAIVARRSSYPRGHHVDPHWHDRAQFIFAVEGTMRVRARRHAWLVPPSRALWVPSHTVHQIEMYGVVEMRSLYVNGVAAAGMPSSCVVLNVTPLLRELVLRAVALPVGYDE